MAEPRTIAQKILAAHGVEDVTPGAFGLADVALVMANEVSGSVALTEFERTGAERVFDPDRVALFADHFAPAKDVRSAELVGRLRRFARDQGIEHYWEAGSTANAGIEHTVLPEEGLIAPGDFIVGGDSHTCTYGAFGALGTGMGSTDIAVALALGQTWVRVPQSIRVEYRGSCGAYVTGKDLILAYLAHSGVSGATYAALEFAGPPIDRTSVDERMALCNMAVEAGAKTGIVAADETTLEWLAPKVGDRALEPVLPDDDAVYEQRVEIGLDGMPPLVARPPSPGDVAPVGDVAGAHVDQVYVGNCSNGTITDLRQLCRLLEGRSVARGTRLIVVPASQRVYRQALTEGLLETIVAAGGAVSMPTCGACFGGHMGIIAAGETAVATTNRNFRGRMGHPDSQVFLANAYVAGAAAVTGELCDPAEVLG
ncbi:3-isopropylmalate dehydratase large subunit [Capillimicrobium parvum]|uniref:3-isopropylmalate dehydratase large subunit n=1 Tax=Capillimicrobium parvum TaxID=2884022 RepID=A0A9E6Y580_9ACTN|nr:3-isopropylmalate dehydratase large subunit [Capillimicrobium parvum]UGS39146.1 3-isopropylmalate dehydratase large subunit [Capillimicrobium parvum]